MNENCSPITDRKTDRKGRGQESSKDHNIQHTVFNNNTAQRFGKNPECSSEYVSENISGFEVPSGKNQKFENCSYDNDLMKSFSISSNDVSNLVSVSNSVQYNSNSDKLLLQDKELGIFSHNQNYPNFEDTNSLCEDIP